MKLRHLKNIISPVGDGGFHNVTDICWSPNNLKLAVSTSEKQVIIFDDSGERKDKFSTKASDSQSTLAYKISGIAYSPDSTKLAVAQSDGAVFVYKLGAEWGEKKSICNKFLISNTEVTCLVWPKEQANNIIFGTMDGKVRIGNIKTNKANVLFETESPVIALTANISGNAILSGHLDGSVCRFYFNGTSLQQGRIFIHKSPPFCLAWGETILVASNDRKIVIYNDEGKVTQVFDYSGDQSIQDFTVSSMSPSGQSVVFGGYNMLTMLSYSKNQKAWSESKKRSISNLYAVTAIGWRQDGARLTIGNMNGQVDLFEVCLKKILYKQKFEFTYVSPSQVIVKRLLNGSRIVLKSAYGHEITGLDVYQEQFIVAKTSETLLCGDLLSCQLSEVLWRSGGKEKFYFDCPSACVVFNAGELAVIEYGSNEIVGLCRTEYMNPRQISIRMNERKSSSDVKKIAYLADLQTIQVQDLITGSIISTIMHNHKIDWLELSGKANSLLFRDRKHRLFLHDIETNTAFNLLNYCSYVQWVPDSDVIVAQSGQNLFVWYSFHDHEKSTTISIKGDIDTIDRSNGKTNVIIDDGLNSYLVELDESRIEFGTALEDHDFTRAISLLEKQELSAETEAMWKNLADIALKERLLAIAERCYAAMGNVSMSAYLQKINNMPESNRNSGDMGFYEHPKVRAKLAIIDKQFNLAESILLEQGRMNEAMEMYQELHKWDLAIRVAEIRNHPELQNLKSGYFQWLLESGQEGKAAELREREGDYVNAIQLFVKGGFPGKAASLLNQHRDEVGNEIAEKIAMALLKAGLYEKAGELFEQTLKQDDRAMDAYLKGKSFRKAIELSRRTNPDKVIGLEEQWGDYLVSVRQMDSAVNHFIESGKLVKAFQAAMAAKQWRKASSIVDTIHPSENAKPFHLDLANHYKEEGDLSYAERHYVHSGKGEEAVEMYLNAREWDKAFGLANSIMPPDDVNFTFVNEARKLESEGKIEEAEKVFLLVKEPDMAINMYKNRRDYDSMIRLVTIYHNDLLEETHVFLAKGLESEGNYKQAEHHFIQGNDWRSALNMYCSNNMYEEAYRLSKSSGGVAASSQVAYLWARSLGGEAAAKLLHKLSLLESAIDFAAENGAFEFAFELCKFAPTSQAGAGIYGKEKDIFYKKAMFLEDEGQLKDAEASFIAAGKPREAILMYIHNQDWESAQIVAEKHDPGSLQDILTGQAKVAFDQKDFTKFESFLLRCQKLDLAIETYKDANMWQDALRFASVYVPSKLPELQAEYDSQFGKKKDLLIKIGQSRVDSDSDLFSLAKSLEQQGEYTSAIDMYLKYESSDVSMVEKALDRAVEIAFKFTNNRGVSVCKAAAYRLLELNKYDHAGELFLDGEMYRESIDSFIKSESWEKAKEVANTYLPKMKDYVENAMIESLKSNNDANQLLNVDLELGLNLLAKNNEWAKCLQAAKSHGPDILSRYLTIMMKKRLGEDNIMDAAEALIQYGIPILSKDSLVLCQNIAREVFSRKLNQAYDGIRDIFYKIIKSPAVIEFKEEMEFMECIMLTAHLLSIRGKCQNHFPDLATVAAKQSISLLRYADYVPMDQVYFDAGHFAKNSGMMNMAFVCFNRYLDIADAIEDGVGMLSDNADFAGTDVPFRVKLPKKNLPESEREEVRDWILSESLDQKSEKRYKLDFRSCEACGESIFAASLICKRCKQKSEPCIVTGYPVSAGSLVKCPSCCYQANRDDWNKFTSIFKCCPFCSASASVTFNMI